MGFRSIKSIPAFFRELNKQKTNKQHRRNVHEHQLFINSVCIHMWMFPLLFAYLELFFASLVSINYASVTKLRSWLYFVEKTFFPPSNGSLQTQYSQMDATVRFKQLNTLNKKKKQKTPVATSATVVLRLIWSWRRCWGFYYFIFILSFLFYTIFLRFGNTACVVNMSFLCG